MLADTPGHRPWHGSEQGFPDLLLHLHVHTALGRDDEHVPVLRLAQATEGRLVWALGPHSVHGDLNGVVVGLACQELGGKYMHGVVPEKWF